MVYNESNFVYLKSTGLEKYYKEHKIRIQSSINKRKINVERMIEENMNSDDKESLFNEDNIIGGN